ncbi:MAG: methyltransferase domain-containing protein [Minwuia sp.]|uniref:methyltransferase domain-containing protein n=1 Tax=Minwuia sp. TaxID=2493630 RepID=UPI003A88B7D4
MADNVWNPHQYLKGGMAGLRTRPALDLLQRIPLNDPKRVVDLGCGPGNSTAPLKQRWPDAEIIGIDNSPAMLQRARETHPDIAFVEGDIADWTPDGPVDVIFSNAAIHWVANHGLLLPRLYAALAPGGCLAVQQPNNFDADSHALIREVAGEPRFRTALQGKLLGEHTMNAAWYHDLLRPLAGELDIWEVEYAQPLEGPDPVLEWVRGTALLPVRQALGDEDFQAFEAIYGQRLLQAYPAAPDGVTVFPFRRMFIFARRP